MNPFVTNGYVSPKYFCDREKETELLTALLTNENKIALISPRRIGKTELLHHCFQQPSIRNHYHTFVIDIYATTSMRDFVNVFGKAILDDLQANRCDRAIDLYHYQLIEEKVIDYLWCHPTLATQGTATGAFETSLSANKKHLNPAGKQGILHRRAAR